VTRFEGLSITTPEGIEAYRILTIRAALRMEVKTGLKSRHNSLWAAQRVLEERGITPVRTRKQALKAMDAICDELEPGVLK
jgi:hypothetical protein